MLAIAAAMLVTGCARERLPEGAPTIRGVVTDLSAEGTGETVGSIRVVWTQDPAVGAQAEYDAAQLAITGKTTLVRGTSVDGTTKPLPFEDLRVGDIVEAWFTDGPVAESYPVQATAAFVLVTGAYEGDLPTPPGLLPPD